MGRSRSAKRDALPTPRVLTRSQLSLAALAAHLSRFLLRPCQMARSALLTDKHSARVGERSHSPSPFPVHCPMASHVPTPAVRSHLPGRQPPLAISPSRSLRPTLISAHPTRKRTAYQLSNRRFLTSR